MNRIAPLCLLIGFIVALSDSSISQTDESADASDPARNPLAPRLSIPLRPRNSSEETGTVPGAFVPLRVTSPPMYDPTFRLPDTAERLAAPKERIPAQAQGHSLCPSSASREGNTALTFWS